MYELGHVPFFYLNFSFMGLRDERYEKVSRLPTVLQEILEPTVTAMGYEYVGCEYLPHPGNCILRVYIDAPEGITLDDCERVSHQLSAVLDVEDPIPAEYCLEISSPGLNRRLFKEADYTRFQGRTAKVRMDSLIDGRRNFTGVIEGIEHHKLKLSVDGEVIELEFEGIDKANLVSDE